MMGINDRRSDDTDVKRVFLVATSAVEAIPAEEGSELSLLKEAVVDIINDARDNLIAELSAA